MSRIYLKKRKKNSYWIKDILDDKKYGLLTKYGDTIMVKIKNKYKLSYVGNEARFSNNRFNLNWPDIWAKYIKQYNKNLFNTDNYHFPIFFESIRLKSCDLDMFGRPTLLHPAVKKAWVKMKSSAILDNVDIQIISAFRSLDYQQQLILSKVDKGLLIDDILKVNVLPGYSEHHTGCAIDIGSKNEVVLEEEFDQSDAFWWLVKNAEKFGFYMSYPKDNTTGICYEPWHWCYKVKEPLGSRLLRL